MMYKWKKIVCKAITYYLLVEFSLTMTGKMNSDIEINTVFHMKSNSDYFSFYAMTIHD